MGAWLALLNGGLFLVVRPWDCVVPSPDTFNVPVSFRTL